MIERTITSSLLGNLEFFPIVGIVGPRQVGKTTLAKSLQARLSFPSLYLDLELDSDLQKLKDAETFLSFHQEKCIIIDEIQREPELFALLRALVDQERRPARFIILGSASPTMIRKSSETLAGRIAYTELNPFSLLEISPEISMRQHWLRGGFPPPLLAKSERNSWIWLNNFIRTFIERDLRELGYDIPSQNFRRLLLMLSHIQGKLLNYSDLARALGLSAPTIRRYLDLLEGSFLIQRLQPYYINIGKRLVKSPKVYIRDTGILHELLQIRSEEALIGNIAIGGSWEGYVIEQIRRNLFQEPEMYFYRTHAGAELDLFMVLSNNTKVAIEIKSTNSPKLTKGFFETLSDLSPTHTFVIIPDGDPYPKDNGIKVVNLSHFIRVELPQLASPT
ncbi:MAG: ATP-binding protein [Bacteroidota bacterium]